MVGLLWRALEDFVRAPRISAGFMAPGDLELDAYTLVQPDVYVLPLVDGRRPGATSALTLELTPLFVEAVGAV